MMSKIHNNPKLEGPRMPIILPDELVVKWLVDYNDELDRRIIEDLIKEFPSHEMTAHTVHKLRVKISLGNSEEASSSFSYKELPNLEFD